MVTRLGVDILGFNFYPESPRYISPREAQKIIRRLPPTVISVGILVHPTWEEALGIRHISGVNWLQVYPAESMFNPEALDVPVIICQRVSEDTPHIAIPSGADFLLLDAYHPRQLGGTGQTFAWERIPVTLPREQLVLAGGIHPGNIEQALQTVQPAIIDVASGSERKPGIKDFHKVKALQAAVLRFNLEKLTGPHTTTGFVKPSAFKNQRKPEA